MNSNEKRRNRILDEIQNKFNCVKSISFQPKYTYAVEIQVSYPNTTKEEYLPSQKQIDYIKSFKRINVYTNVDLTRISKAAASVIIQISNNYPDLMKIITRRNEKENA